MPHDVIEPTRFPNQPHYFFEAVNNQLKFQLDINLSNPRSLRSFLDIFDVTELSKIYPALLIDYKNNSIQIGLNPAEVSSPQFTQQLIEFIEKLKEHGILERHENINALWFYSQNNGDEILKFRNYPPALQTHLAAEHQKFIKIIQTALSKQHYTHVVEVGCGAELENLQVAKKTNLKYLGVEFSPSAAQMAQVRAGQQTDTAVKCLDVLKVSPKRLPLSPNDHPIFIFPFNLLGNIAPISLLFTKLRAFSYDFIVSIYRLDSDTEKMRLAYYTNCGYTNINVNTDSKGNVTFSSPDGLYSVAYNRKYLEDLLATLGFKVKTYQSSKHGLMLYAKAKKGPFLKQDAIAQVTNSPSGSAVLSQYEHHRRPSTPQTPEAAAIPALTLTSTPIQRGVAPK